MPLGPPPPGGYSRKPIASVVPAMLRDTEGTGHMPIEGCPLTERQLQVVWLASYGLTNAEIGDRMALAPNTVKTHLVQIGKILGARNRAHTVAICLRDGFVR